MEYVVGCGNDRFCHGKRQLCPWNFIFFHMPAYGQRTYIGKTEMIKMYRSTTVVAMLVPDIWPLNTPGKVALSDYGIR